MPAEVVLSFSFGDYSVQGVYDADTDVGIISVTKGHETKKYYGKTATVSGKSGITIDDKPIFTLREIETVPLPFFSRGTTSTSSEEKTTSTPAVGLVP